MSTAAIPPTRLPPAASAATEAASDTGEAVEYPGRRWTAQSVWHGHAIGQAMSALQNHFRAREDVLVAMKLAVYYRRGDPETFLQPDVQVTFGVGRPGDWHSYLVWEEGKAPDFVLELASPLTAGRDARPKARDYLRIGVREYWRLDPQGSLMRRPLEGYEASGGRYEPVAAVRGPGGHHYLRSRVLGLDLRSQQRDGPRVLVFRDPRTEEEFNGSLKEAEQRRRAAEFKAEQEAHRTRAAQKQIERDVARTRCAEANRKRCGPEARCRGADIGIGAATPESPRSNRPDGDRILEPTPPLCMDGSCRSQRD